jgi:hypothetical protein
MIKQADLKEGIGIQQSIDSLPGSKLSFSVLLFYFFGSTHFKGAGLSFGKFLHLFFERHYRLPPEEV